LKPKLPKIEESKWAVVLWKHIKKALLHNFHNEYCNGKRYDEDDIMNLKEMAESTRA
jgi:hypothetical protein